MRMTTIDLPRQWAGARLALTSIPWPAQRDDRPAAAGAPSQAVPLFEPHAYFHNFPKPIPAFPAILARGLRDVPAGPVGGDRLLLRGAAGDALDFARQTATRLLATQEPDGGFGAQAGVGVFTGISAKPCARSIGFGNGLLAPVALVAGLPSRLVFDVGRLARTLALRNRTGRRPSGMEGERLASRVRGIRHDIHEQRSEGGFTMNRKVARHVASCAAALVLSAVPALAATTPDQDFTDETAYQVKAYYGGAKIRATRLPEVGPTGRPVLNVKFMSTGQNAGVNVSWTFPAQAPTGKTFYLQVRPKSPDLPYLRCSFTDDKNRRVSHHVYFHVAGAKWRTLAFPYGKKGEASTFESAVKTPGAPVTRATIQICGVAGGNYELDISDFTSEPPAARKATAPPADTVLRAAASQAEAITDISPLMYVGQRDIQAIIDAAPPHGTVVVDRAESVTLGASLAIDKPLTLKGLKARLAEGADQTPLLLVCANGVTVSDFTLVGNLGSVSKQGRASLISVLADDFVIENGSVSNSARHGVLVTAARRGRDCRNGVVRNIAGYRIDRDVVSIEGAGERGRAVRDVRVENIRGYNSPSRGTVEVADGCEDILVSNVYAESSVYGVDVSDHNQPKQANRRITVMDVSVKNCAYAVKAGNTPKGHCGLVIRNVVGEGRWRPDGKWPHYPITVSYTDDVTIENVRIRDLGKPTAIRVRSGTGVTIRNVQLDLAGSRGPAVLVGDCSKALLDGITIRGNPDPPRTGILYTVSSGATCRRLDIRNVTAGSATTAGILLDRAGGGTLEDYTVTGNTATVVDRIKGKNAVIRDNRAGGP